MQAVRKEPGVRARNPRDTFLRMYPVVARSKMWHLAEHHHIGGEDRPTISMRSRRKMEGRAARGGPYWPAGMTNTKASASELPPASSATSTVNDNIWKTETSGAMNTGVGEASSDSVTSAPPVWLHR